MKHLSSFFFLIRKLDNVKINRKPCPMLTRSFVARRELNPVNERVGVRWLSAAAAEWDEVRTLE